MSEVACSEDGNKRTKQYPAINPYQTGFLSVCDIHQIYYEQSGNNKGKPVLYVHGGPGSGTSDSNRQFFDPDVYRIILFDQRGAGKSRPSGELRENTTWDLINDIESLRKHLCIEKWVVFGGSWGSALSLAYAQSYPDRIKALVLRGIFTCRRKEVVFCNQEGNSYICPDKYEAYSQYIPESERYDITSAYYRRLTCDDPIIRLEAAKAFSSFEKQLSKLIIDDSPDGRPNQEIEGQARIECHYLVNGGFFESDGQLLENKNIDIIRNKPATIVQGRYDLICPMETAWLLHKKWPEADFHIVPDAGHDWREPGILAKLVAAAEKYKIL